VPVSVTQADFQLSQEYDNLRVQLGKRLGAIVQFVGLVRDFNESNDVNVLELQHYPGMTERVITEICSEAKSRWDIFEPQVIHRVGKLAPGDQIVLVSVGSAHRKDAFSACEFIMDQLKTKATFWKKEFRNNAEEEAQWLETKTSDHSRAERWNKQNKTI